MKKKKKYTIKTKGRMVVIFAFFGAIILTLGYTFLYNLKQISDMNTEKKSLQTQKKELLKEEDTTLADIKRLSDSTYIARFAREKYLYSKEGEIILRIRD